MKVRLELIGDDSKVIDQKQFDINFAAVDGKEVDRARVALAAVLAERAKAEHLVAEAKTRLSALDAAILAATSLVEEHSRKESAMWTQNVWNWLASKLEPFRAAEQLKADEAKLAARRSELAEKK